MKVKASKDFQFYRHAVFQDEMSKEKYRALQNGNTVDIEEKFYKKYKNVFEKVSPKKEITEVSVVESEEPEIKAKVKPKKRKKKVSIKEKASEEKIVKKSKSKKSEKKTAIKKEETTETIADVETSDTKEDKDSK